VILGPTVRMALETKPLRQPQEIVGIAPVSEMARQAAVATRRPGYVVIIYERPLLVGMTSEGGYQLFIRSQSCRLQADISPAPVRKELAQENIISVIGCMVIHSASRVEVNSIIKEACHIHAP